MLSNEQKKNIIAKRRERDALIRQERADQSAHDAEVTRIAYEIVKEAVKEGRACPSWADARKAAEEQLAKGKREKQDAKVVPFEGKRADPVSTPDAKPTH